MEDIKYLRDYTQTECEQYLMDGFNVGVKGSSQPATDFINIPHRIKEIRDDEDKIIGFVIYKVQLQQSDEWDEYFAIVQEKPNQSIPGSPFKAGWPKEYGGQKYQIITMRGELLEARVDDSREFSSEGLEWATVGYGNKEGSWVAAWKQLWQR